MVHHVGGQYHIPSHLLARPSVMAPGTRGTLTGTGVLLGMGTWGSVWGVLRQVLRQRRLSSHGVYDGLWLGGSWG